MEHWCSWPSWISAHIRSHSEKGPERPKVPPDHGCDGQTVSPSPQSNSQTSAGLTVSVIIDISDPPCFPSFWLQLSRFRRDARFVVASFHQDGQSDPRQLISERNR